MTYRKRGTEVEAFRFAILESDDLAPKWLRDHVTLGRARVHREPMKLVDGELVQMFLDPPSGKGTPLVANVGDWIVRNARGDVFPMTDAKFAETYEAVPELRVDQACPGRGLVGPGGVSL